MRPDPSPWPFRLALATLIAAVPLVFLGGSVTTLHAGMAIDGWLVVDRGRGDFFMPFYPIDRWLNELGPMMEHSHRLFGTLVGCLSIATVVSAFATRSARMVKTAAIVGLLAVIFQGTLGGLRVLENSSNLAFLHGAVGQAVFAALGAVMVVSSRRFQEARHEPSLAAQRALPVSLVATAIVYVQIVLGAWLRHGHDDLVLLAHLLTVLLVVTAILVLAKALRGAGEGSALARLPRWLFTALIAQAVLGIIAFMSVYRFVGPNPTDMNQALFPTLHVVGGAALLASTLASVLWSWRVRSARSEPARARREAGGNAVGRTT
ncbi:MAG: COX15/CtaA family protein [Planctomycetes bacterium]|nr:COX15/CtaA family protein [Planctomycetota bacterium]